MKIKVHVASSDNWSQALKIEDEELKMETEEMVEMLSLLITATRACIFNQLLPVHSITCNTVPHMGLPSFSTLTV